MIVLFVLSTFQHSRPATMVIKQLKTWQVRPVPGGMSVYLLGTWLLGRHFPLCSRRRRLFLHCLCFGSTVLACEKEYNMSLRKKQILMTYKDYVCRN